MNLKLILKDYKPVTDSKVTWLRNHRASVALLLCVMSGPWRFKRRFAMQENALRILGKRDFTQLELNDIKSMCALDWHYNILRVFWNLLRVFNKNPAHVLLSYPKQGTRHVMFDEIFDVHYSKHSTQEMLRWFLELFRYYKQKPYILREEEYHKLFSKLPKVLGMFVRDYLYLDGFPIDRHVRKALKDLGLPTRQEPLLQLFKDNKMKARYYARAMFLDKASNPTHPSTRRR